MDSKKARRRWNPDYRDGWMDRGIGLGLSVPVLRNFSKKLQNSPLRELKINFQPKGIYT